MARTYPKPLFEGERPAELDDLGAVGEPHDGWTPDLSVDFHDDQGEGPIEPRYGSGQRTHSRALPRALGPGRGGRRGRAWRALVDRARELL